MIAIKRTKVSGVDLAREERINKVDLIIQDFEELLKNARFTKLASRKPPVGDMAKKLYQDINSFIKATTAEMC